MNTGGEVAGIIASMYAEVGKKSLEIGGQLISYLFLALVKKAAEKGEKLTTGQINMKKLLESGEELKQISLNNDKSAMQFIDKAKKAGLTFALLDDNVSKEGSTTVFFKAKDIEIVQAIMKQIEADKKSNIDVKVDKSIIEEFSIVSDKSAFITDREDPENYIKTSIETMDLQKGYLINPKNPDEYIYFEENIKDKTVSLEIHADGKVDKLDASNSKYEDRVNNIRKTIEKWGAVELVSSDEERLRFRDKAMEERKGAEKDKKKTLDKVKDEVKETRDKQPSKDTKTKAKSKSKSKKGKSR